MRTFSWLKVVAATLPAMMLSTALVHADDKDKKTRVEKRQVIVIENDEDVEQGQAPKGRRVERRVIVLGDDQGGGDKKRNSRVKRRVIVLGEDGAAAGIGKYWLGLRAESLSGALKSQLDLEGGLVVEEVVDGGPAAKAGIRQHDILLKAGDSQLTDLGSLVKAVSQAKGERMSVVVLRKGTQKTLKVTPAKRPKDAIAVERLPKGENVEEIIDLLEGLGGGGEFKFPRKMLFMGPGFKMPKDLKDLKIDLPANTSISITKPKDGPARIKVEVDGKAWEVTEDNIDELPEKISKAVQGMLEERADRFLNELPQGFRLDDMLLNRGREGGLRWKMEDRSNMDQKMEQILKRLEQLQKELEAIKADREDERPTEKRENRKRNREAKPVGA